LTNCGRFPTTVTIRMVWRQSWREGRMMAMDAARKLVGGVIGLVAGAAKHAAWYLRYQLDGEARDDPGDRQKS
jgi:hypothetical protein